MGWLAFLRITAIAILFYGLLPAATLGGEERTLSRWVSSFIRFAFLIELSVTLLGLRGMALPGMVFPLIALSVAYPFIRRQTWLFKGEETRRQRIVSAVHTWAQRSSLFRTPRMRWPWSWMLALWSCGTLLLLLRNGWFAIHYLRFTHWDGYTHALSLAVLGTGQTWTIDPAIPLFLPLYYLSALTAPEVIAYARIATPSILALAAAFTAYELSRSQMAAALAAALAAAAPHFQDGAQFLAMDLGIAFALLAVGLWARARSEALLAGILAGIMVVSPYTAPSLGSLLVYGCCVLVGVAAARLGMRKSDWVLPLVAVGIALSGTGRNDPGQPIQYEAAARLAHDLASDLPRNTWTLVSPSHEISYILGAGWHVEIADFVANSDLRRVSDPSFHFPFPVRDVIFFVERQPLGAGFAASLVQSPALHTPENTAQIYSTPLERAGVEFKAAEILTAYSAHHEDLETMFDDGRLVVYRVPGTLRARGAD